MFVRACTRSLTHNSIISVHCLMKGVQCKRNRQVKSVSNVHTHTHTHSLSQLDCVFHYAVCSRVHFAKNRYGCCFARSLATRFLQSHTHTHFQRNRIHNLIKRTALYLVVSEAQINRCGPTSQKHTQHTVHRSHRISKNLRFLMAL